MNSTNVKYITSQYYQFRQSEGLLHFGVQSYQCFAPWICLHYGPFVSLVDHGDSLPHIFLVWVKLVHFLAH